MDPSIPDAPPPREPRSDDLGLGPPDQPTRSRDGAAHRRRPVRPDDAGKRPKPKRRNILWRWRRVFFLMGLLGMAGIAAGVAMIAQVELPEIQDLQQSSFICAANVAAEECNSNSAMATISAEEARENVSLEDVPDVVVEAIVASEDRNFYSHQGINPVGIGRALYQDIRAGGLSQGGSTITQQFVKNRLLSNERSLTRKLEEAVLAIKVEQEMSKDEIMEGYLNSIYWGRNAYGIQAASQAYFGKDVADLGIPEAAYLAGLIRAPSLADFEENPEEAARRRRTALDAMLAMDYISQEERDMADAVPFSGEGYRLSESFRQIRTQPELAQVGGDYLTVYAKQQADQILRDSGFTDEEIGRGGFRIYTTIDPTLQGMAWHSVYDTLNDPANDPSGALVSLDSQGRIKAMVSGRNWQEYNVNLAIQGRQVGSTFKPIALATAIEAGASMLETRVPAPGTATIQPPEGSQCDPWEVSNFDEEDAETGSFDLVEATQYSSNTAYGALMAELTPAKVAEMAQKLGMDSELGACLPTVLGADNSTPLEMAEVYSTFANRGVHREPTIIERIERVHEDGERELIYGYQPGTGDRALAEPYADRVNHALQAVIADGTGHGADIGMPAAGKTGTTQSNRDAWFCGFVPQLTTSVWMGYPEADEPLVDEDTGQPLLDDNGQQLLGLRSMRDVHGVASVTGGSLPATIWKNYMSQAVPYLQLTEGTFPEVSDDQLREGEPLIEAAPPTTTTLPPDGPGGGPSTSGPEFTVPTSTEPTRPRDSTTTSSSTTSTPTTDITVFPPGGPTTAPG